MMKSALLALTASSLLGAALAHHPRHADFHEKRQASQQALQYPCCGTVVTVTVYPTSTPAPAPAAPAAAATTVAPKQANVPAAAPVAAPAAPAAAPAAPAVVQVVPVPVPAAPSAAAAPAVASSAASSSGSGSGSGGAGIVVNGNKWAMTYTPYTTTGDCKDQPGVLADLVLIKAKGFTTIRLYGTDCNTLQYAASGAVSIGLKVIVGVFLKSSVSEGPQQISEIIAWGNQGSNWGSVVMAVIGNEAITGHGISAGALAGLVAQAKAQFVAAGQAAIPITTTETVDGFNGAKGQLCGVVDVVACNVQPFFDGKQAPANAGAFVAQLLDQAKTFCPGKEVYSLETGWPSGGPSNGVSIASPFAQQQAVLSISQTVGPRVAMFSFSNDDWKPAGIEQHFGCANWF